MLALLCLPKLPQADPQTTPGLRCLCASAASDASVVIWGTDSSCFETESGGSSEAEGGRGWRQLQLIPGGENVTLALSLGCIMREGGELHVFLAVGGTGGGVRLFSFNSSSGTFDHAANLTGTCSPCCCYLLSTLFFFFILVYLFSQVIPTGSKASAFHLLSQMLRSSLRQAVRTAPSALRAFFQLHPLPQLLPPLLALLVKSFKLFPPARFPLLPLYLSYASSTQFCARTLIGFIPCAG